MSWQRRLAPPFLGAGIAAATAAIVNAITNPYAEKVDDAYRYGAQTGLVLRYTTLGALAAWLVDLLARHARRHGSLRAALAERCAALLQAVALLAVVLVAVIPMFVGGYGADDELRDSHAGFIDGCRENAPASYCECLWTRLRKDPATDTLAELNSMNASVIATGTPPPPLRRAVRACSP